jgi:predicted RNase H-like nuclease (RuvC/YqgF family)
MNYKSARKADMRDDDELKRCHAEIQRLKAENQDLRRASESFGDLADRLNQELQAGRRLRTTDRRQTPDTKCHRDTSWLTKNRGQA